jgi:outer membrane cobalamin receptor
MELTCADPQAPCRLPNSFVADPPLKPVVARTLELGLEVRGEGVEWNAALFRSTLRDDIQFIASPGGTQQGYFENVGRTRRQGLELGLRLQGEATSLTLRYAYLDARFLTGFVEHSPWNSSADAEGRIVVPPGARLPGLARQQLKLRLQWQDERFTLGADAQALGSSLSLGDENNLAAGSHVPGHALLHLDARWRIEPKVELFARIANLFDRRVQSFGVLGRNAFTGPGRSFDLANAQAEPFRGPGAPRTAWAGVRCEWR